LTKNEIFDNICSYASMKIWSLWTPHNGYFSAWVCHKIFWNLFASDILYWTHAITRLTQNWGIMPMMKR